MVGKRVIIKLGMESIPGTIIDVIVGVTYWSENASNDMKTTVTPLTKYLFEADGTGIIKEIFPNNIESALK